MEKRVRNAEPLQILSACIIFFVVIDGTLSLPVLKYPRAISVHNNNNRNIKKSFFNSNIIEFPRSKPVSDLVFESDSSSRKHNNVDITGLTPVIDIYNDRIFFRDPEPRPSNALGYKRSFPTTTTSLPETADYRRFANQETRVPVNRANLEPGKTDSSSTEDILNIGGNTDGQNQVPLEWLQDWVSRNNKTAQKPPPSGEPPRNEREELEFAFQSLFQVPSVKDRASPPCPPHLRRNHHGKCVRPLRIRLVIEEESSS